MLRIVIQILQWTWYSRWWNYLRGDASGGRRLGTAKGATIVALE